MKGTVRTGAARLAGAVPAVLALLGTATAAQAQDARGPWKRQFDVAGSLFVGNRPQTVLTTRARVSHADSTYELGGDIRFLYGEVSEDGDREVSQRGWLGTANLDFWPHARHSPFFLGTAETSLERRIDLRLSGGVGHKYTFVDREGAAASLSVALLAERSRLPDAELGVRVVELARFSTRLRVSRQVGSRAALALESFYRPEAARFAAYTLSNTASVGYEVNDLLNLKLTWQDAYDSQARERGARSNYDGQLVVGLAAEF